MTVELVLRYLVAGLTHGTIHAVVAVGFHVMHDPTGIVDLAQASSRRGAGGRP